MEEATGTEEAEVAEALLSEPPPPQGMKAAKWSGFLVDNRPPFISCCNPLVGALRARRKDSDGRSRESVYVRFRLSARSGVHAFFIRNCCSTFGPNFTLLEPDEQTSRLPTARGSRSASTAMVSVLWVLPLPCGGYKKCGNLSPPRRGGRTLATCLGASSRTSMFRCCLNNRPPRWERTMVQANGPPSCRSRPLHPRSARACWGMTHSTSWACFG